jgi:hypothetical protein
LGVVGSSNNSTITQEASAYNPVTLSGIIRASAFGPPLVGVTRGGPPPFPFRLLSSLYARESSSSEPAMAANPYTNVVSTVERHFDGLLSAACPRADGLRRVLEVLQC